MERRWLADILANPRNPVEHAIWRRAVAAPSVAAVTPFQATST